MGPAAIKEAVLDTEVTSDGLLNDNPALRGHQRNEEKEGGGWMSM